MYRYVCMYVCMYASTNTHRAILVKVVSLVHQPGARLRCFSPPTLIQAKAGVPEKASHTHQGQPAAALQQ